jgi:hypothetical protein
MAEGVREGEGSEAVARVGEGWEAAAREVAARAAARVVEGWEAAGCVGTGQLRFCLGRFLVDDVLPGAWRAAWRMQRRAATTGTHLGGGGEGGGGGGANIAAYPTDTRCSFGSACGKTWFTMRAKPLSRAGWNQKVCAASVPLAHGAGV